MNVLDRMRAAARLRSREGRDAETRATRALDEWSGARGFIKNTPELQRVMNLPRHEWTDRSDLDELVQIMTDHYRTPTGSMVLRPCQAVMLEHFHDHAGGFGVIGVGEGKTLVSYLAGPVVDASRVALVVPAKLKDKTHRDFAELSRHWRAPADVRVMSYELLGRVQGADILENYAPDLVVLDEAHKVKNSGAAVSRRVVRFLRETQTRLLAMSGSTITRSLLDQHHILALALGVHRMPLPAPRSECRQWARCVDEKTPIRSRPGALELMTEQSPTLDNIRAAVGRRIQETPGVVRTVRASVDIPIHLDFLTPRSSATAPLMRALIKDRVDPNGDACLPVDVYRHIRTLVAGFWYQWQPPPPLPWMDARREWKRLARDILDQELPGYDSELQVANGVDRGDVEDYGTLQAWRNVKDTYTPDVVARWETDEILQAALDTIMTPTIVWVEHRAVGHRLAHMTGWPYYANQGLAANGSNIMDADPGGSIIASIAANSEGRNLQAWSHNLVITPPANGRAWEQLLGRTHRPGQDADVVHVTVVLGHSLVREHFEQAVKDARFIQAATGQEQKLLLADLA
jgi:hypothetical protein